MKPVERAKEKVAKARVEHGKEGGQGGKGARQKMQSEEDEEDERTVVAPDTGSRWLRPPGHDGSEGGGEERGSDRRRKGR